MPIPNLLLETEQVCERYGISRTTLFRRIAENDFPSPTQRGRPHTWLVAALDIFDQQCVEKSLQRLDRNPIKPFLRN